MFNAQDIGIDTCNKLAIVQARTGGLSVLSYSTERALAEAAINRAWSEMSDVECAAWLRSLADKVDAEATSACEEVSGDE